MGGKMAAKYPMRIIKTILKRRFFEMLRGFERRVDESRCDADCDKENGNFYGGGFFCGFGRDFFLFLLNEVFFMKNFV